jgi:hypothetical protein
MNWVNDPKTRKGVLVERGTGKLITRSNGQPFQQARTVKITPGVVIETYREFAIQEGIEEYIPWMYLDTKNNVTVGIGHLLTDAGEAKKLTFDLRERPQPNLARPARPEIHPKHIENAFIKVRDSGLTNTKAEGFKPLTHIILRADEIERVFKEDVEQKIDEIGHTEEFKDFNSFPQTAKLGLLDIAFNTGVARILEFKEKGSDYGFPIFTDAVTRRDWSTAAKQSGREKATDDRNTAVRRWFEEAARLDPFFIAKPREMKRWDAFLK